MSARIRPVPDDAEAAAIVAALELLWPVPVAAAPANATRSQWRFSGRSWHQPQGWPRRDY